LRYFYFYTPFVCMALVLLFSFLKESVVISERFLRSCFTGLLVVTSANAFFLTTSFHQREQELLFFPSVLAHVKN